MRYARISDGYRLATSALTTRCATPVANRCSAAPLCGVPSPALVRGQRRARAQVRAHEQRIDHAGRRAGIGEPLVAARRHARERERGAAEHRARARRPPRRRPSRSGARAPGSRAIDRRRSDRRGSYSRSGPAMPRCRATALSPCPADRAVEKSWRSTASSVSISSRPGATKRICGAGVFVASRRRAARRAGAGPATRSARARAARRGDARAAIEERQVEAVQVVVLDHVGIRRLTIVADEPANQVRLGRVVRRRAPRGSSVAPYGSRTATMKMRSRDGIEPGRLEVELHAVQSDRT